MKHQTATLHFLPDVKFSDFRWADHTWWVAGVYSGVFIEVSSNLSHAPPNKDTMYCACVENTFAIASDMKPLTVWIDQQQQAAGTS